MAQVARSLTVSGTPRTQLLSIQYLRGLAALSVLATHALQWPLAEMWRYLTTNPRALYLLFNRGRSSAADQTKQD
jgi:peptidoglycan/LPS O-acetylase OafA/YrhL